jgi:WD40 repeat protein
VFTKKKELIGHAGAIYCCVSNDDFLYSTAADRFVTRWQVNKGVQDPFSIRLPHASYAIELIGNKYLLAGLNTGGLHVFDLESRKEIKYFSQHVQAIFSIKYNAPKSFFCVGDADGNISVWSVIDFELLLYLPIGCGKIRHIAFSTDGELMALSCQDEKTRIFETTHFNEISTFASHQGGASCSQFHPSQDDLLLTGGKDAYLKIWKWRTGILQKAIPAHNYVLYDILFIKNEEKFVTASRDKSVKIWDATSFTVDQRLDRKSDGHLHSVNRLVKLTENSFASVSDDKRIIVWMD